MEYDYTYTIETNEHVMLRDQPSTNGSVVSEIAAGIRVLGAEPVAGGSYSDCGGGDKWYPVEYPYMGSNLHGFIAEGCCRIV